MNKNTLVVLLVIVAAFIGVFVVLPLWMVYKPPMPNEIKASVSALEKLEAGLTVGLTPMEYDRLLLDAKIAAKTASGKLPTAFTAADMERDDSQIEPDKTQNRLRFGHMQMLSAVNRYNLAGELWKDEIMGRGPSGAGTGAYVRQELWKQAGYDVNGFRIAMKDVYADD